MSPVRQSLGPAFVTLALGSALNLLGIQQGWASQFDWLAAIGVPATVGVMGWCATTSFSIGPRVKSSATPIASSEHGKTPTYATNFILLAIAMWFSSVLFGELFTKNRSTGSIWALAAMFTAVSAAALSTSSRRHQSSQLPSTGSAN